MEKISVICSMGHPRSPKTWSNTPNNIVQILEKNHFLGEVFESSKNNIFFKTLQLLLKVYYKVFFNKYSSCLNHISKYQRILDGWSSIVYLNNSSNKNLLHFGTLGLPLTKVPENQNHYIYVDSTWNLWSKQATDLKLISDRDIEIINNLEIEAYSNVRHIFSISEYVKDNLIKEYGIPDDRITVVGTGTGIIKPYFGDKNYTNGKILFVAKGRFKDKGGDIVLNAFYKALESFPNLELSIVGQNDYSSKINHPNIKTYGFVTIDILQELFNSHSLFLMPALNEPWGLVYVEAMLCRMPIIGLNRNSFPELSGYGKYGFGIDSPNPDVLAEMIVDLMGKPEILEEKGSFAQDFAINKFSWEKTCDMIFDKISVISKN